MRFEPGYLLGMVMQCVPEPRKVARDVLGLHFSRGALWQAFALFLVLSTGLGVAASILFPVDPATVGPLLSSPLIMGVIEAALMTFAVFAIYGVGQALGGKGSFDDGLLIVIWLQFVMFVVDLGVIALGLFAPLMAILLQLGGVGLSFWILSHFIAEAHGFRSTGLVFLMILITIMAALLVLSIVLALSGLGPDMAPGAGGI